MNAKEIIEKCSHLEIAAKRRMEDDYVEVVVFSRDISKWQEFLNSIFGPAVSPIGARPTQEDIKLTEDYGGIFDDQAFYKKDFEKTQVLAMFWPWQDGEKITLKIAVIKKL
ncbi:MAG: hypothetical protein ABIG64_03755 [Candidatus Omnitrophota bacterium]